MQQQQGPLAEFWTAKEDGLLPAAVPYIDLTTGRVGLSASGIHVDPDEPMDAQVAALARSDDKDDRATAAIVACLNVARATMRAHEGYHCETLSPEPCRSRRLGEILTFPISGTEFHAVRVFVRQTLTLESCA